MISISVDKEPADIKVIIFLPFFSFEDFTSSLDTAIHITIETIATTVIIPVDTFDTSLIFFQKFYTYYSVKVPGILISVFIYELEKLKFHY